MRQYIPCPTVSVLQHSRHYSLSKDEIAFYSQLEELFLIFFASSSFNYLIKLVDWGKVLLLSLDAWMWSSRDQHRMLGPCTFSRSRVKPCCLFELA